MLTMKFTHFFDSLTHKSDPNCKNICQGLLYTISFQHLLPFNILWSSIVDIDFWEINVVNPGILANTSSHRVISLFAWIPLKVQFIHTFPSYLISTTTVHTHVHTYSHPLCKINSAITNPQTHAQRLPIHHCFVHTIDNERTVTWTNNSWILQVFE